jgi:hypothetical protein
MAEILKLVDDMEKDSRAQEKELLKLCWYMRGGVTLDEMYTTDKSQRELMGEIVKENLETTKETRLPFF